MLYKSCYFENMIVICEWIIVDIYGLFMALFGTNKLLLQDQSALKKLAHFALNDF